MQVLIGKQWHRQKQMKMPQTMPLRMGKPRNQRRLTTGINPTSSLVGLVSPRGSLPTARSGTTRQQSSRQMTYCGEQKFRLEEHVGITGRLDQLSQAGSNDAMLVEWPSTISCVKMNSRESPACLRAVPLVVRPASLLIIAESTSRTPSR